MLITRLRILSFVPFLTAAPFACGGQVDSQEPTPPASGSQSGGETGASGAAAGSGAGAGSGASSNGTCVDVSGRWLIGQNDCGRDDIVIAQDGCNIAVKWFDPFAGTVSGTALAFKEALGSSQVCTATVDGHSLSGSCKATKADGGPWDCTFEAIFSGK